MSRWLEDHLTLVLVVFGLMAVGIFLAAVICGASSHQPTIAPDGQPAVLVSCSDPRGCFTEAAEACPRGYSVLESADKRGIAVSTTVVQVSKDSSVPITTSSETFSGARLIRCTP